MPILSTFAGWSFAGFIKKLLSSFNSQAWYSDSSTAGQTVTKYGTVNQVNEGGGVYSAEFVDSRSSYLEVSQKTAGDFLFTGPFTIEAYIKNDSTTNSPIGYTIFEVVGNGGANYLAVNSRGNNLNVWLNSANYTSQVNGFLTPGEYNHIALVRDSSNVISLYVNGVGHNIATNSNNLGYANPTTIRVAYDNDQQIASTNKIAGLRVVNGYSMYSSDFDTEMPSSLLTAATGTKLLLNFEATNVLNTLVGKYLYGNGSSASWNTIADWYYDSSHTISAGVFPYSATSVVVQATSASGEVDSSSSFHTPADITINSGKTLTLTSTTGVNDPGNHFQLNCNISGSGNLVLNGIDTGSN